MLIVFVERSFHSDKNPLYNWHCFDSQLTNSFAWSNLTHIASGIKVRLGIGTLRERFVETDTVSSGRFKYLRGQSRS